MADLILDKLAILITAFGFTFVAILVTVMLGYIFLSDPYFVLGLAAMWVMFWAVNRVFFLGGVRYERLYTR
jgi:hypothetical protein